MISPKGWTGKHLWVRKRIESSSGCLLYVGSSEATMDVAKSYVDVKVKTSAGSIVTFSNFPVGEYLPVQVLQLFATGTDAAADEKVCVCEHPCKHMHVEVALCCTVHRLLV